MPSKHSKNAQTRSFFTHHEKTTSAGSRSKRLGTESQLPFGYCPLSLCPIEDAVCSPSGRLYSREAILEYIVHKMKEIKAQQEQHDAESRRAEALGARSSGQQQVLQIRNFAANQVGAPEHGSSAETELNAEPEARHRKRALDEVSLETQAAGLRSVCPWLPQFTPSAEPAPTKAPPKRPTSPFSGQPIRSKDLVPVNLMREDASMKGQDSGPVRFICPVSRRTITTQKVVVIKSTGTLMLESVARETCLPSMRDPLTNRPFAQDDLLELVSASSGFAASGQVIAKKHRPTFN